MVLESTDNHTSRQISFRGVLVKSSISTHSDL